MKTKVAPQTCLPDLKTETRRRLIALVCARIADGESTLGRLYKRSANRQGNAAIAHVLTAWGDEAMRRAEHYGLNPAGGGVPWPIVLWENLITSVHPHLGLRYAAHVQHKTTQLKLALLALLHFKASA